MDQQDILKLKALNILYVEDDKEIQENFGKILRKVFLSVTVASNGHEGLEIFKEKKEKIDFIISDIKMPIMDGLKMYQEIKKLGTNIPCIITTAHGEFDYFVQANEIGIFRYIQKPLDINELFEAVNDYMNGLEVKKISL